METTGGEHGVTWLYPPAGRILNYLDTINITYTSPFASPLLYTWCRNASMPQDDPISGKSIYMPSLPISPATNQSPERRDRVDTNGTFSILLDYKMVSSCYWQLRPNTTRGYGAQSQAVILLPSQRSPAPTIWGLESKPSDPSSTPLVAPPSTPSPDTERVFSTGAKAGIGVGAGIFAIALIGFIFWFVSRRRQQKSDAVPQHAYEKSQGEAGFSSPAPAYDSSIAKPAVEVHNNNQISEMGTVEPETMELDSQSVVPELGFGNPKTLRLEN